MDLKLELLGKLIKSVDGLSSDLDDVGKAIITNSDTGEVAFDKMADAITEGFASVVAEIHKIDERPAMTQREFIQMASIQILAANLADGPNSAAIHAKELWIRVDREAR